MMEKAKRWILKDRYDFIELVAFMLAFASSHQGNFITGLLIIALGTLGSYALKRLK